MKQGDKKTGSRESEPDGMYGLTEAQPQDITVRRGCGRKAAGTL
jgi:hypothetical protein